MGDGVLCRMSQQTYGVFQGDKGRRFSGGSEQTEGVVDQWMSFVCSARDFVICPSTAAQHEDDRIASRERGFQVMHRWRVLVVTQEDWPKPSSERLLVPSQYLAVQSVSVGREWK